MLLRKLLSQHHMITAHIINTVIENRDRGNGLSTETWIDYYDSMIGQEKCAT